MLANESPKCVIKSDTPQLNASIEVTYLDLPCVITGSPVDRTTIDCTDAAAG